MESGFIHLKRPSQNFRKFFLWLWSRYKEFLDSTRRIVSNFRQNGSVKRKEGSGRPKVRFEEVINNVRQMMQEEISVRHLGL
jgi:hypothetical protein